ncbi:uncharacterized protein LOC120161533, partial [Hibiscus syriacus]|uniref:uncharacterized protein LOC120161533 n=1 Tax=Hibiscus syriacus TaxID=106335 RepID=UPI00192103DA
NIIDLEEASRDRKKIDIDGFRLIEASKDEPKQKEEEKKTDGFESKYDLRKSLAWDSAFFTSPGVLDPEELFETSNINAGDKGHNEPSSFPSESMTASRIGDCIARRSLAWDAAFFTSAGMLTYTWGTESRRVVLVNNGYRKSETVTHILPGIEQEFWKSTESDSTLDSDYSLSSLEIDLFDDMRASMQKSSKESNLLNSSSKLQSQTGIPNSHFSKRMDTTSRVKPFPASEGQKLQQMEWGRQQKRPSILQNHMYVQFRILVQISLLWKNISKKPCIGDRGTPSPEHHLHIPTSLLKSFRICCGHSASILRTPCSLRRKNDLVASDSGVRTPTRSLTLHKSKLIDSSQPISLQSTPNSLRTSLLTSIDCWSSESSASLDHVGTGNCSSEQLVPSGSKEARFPHQDVCRFSKGSCHLLSTVSREAKPSGLRLPSTKIGFFEPGNSRELTPNGVKFHSGLHNSSKTRTGTNLNGTPIEQAKRNQKSGDIEPDAKLEEENSSQKSDLLGLLRVLLLQLSCLKLN